MSLTGKPTVALTSVLPGPLVAAVGLGITSALGSPPQLIHAGVGSEAMQYLPFCLIPTVLVPFYLITHALIAAQLRGHELCLPPERARLPMRNQWTRIQLAEVGRCRVAAI